MAATEILMLGAVALGAIIFIKVLPQLQQSAAGAPAAAPAAAGGQGVWAQVPNTTACGMIGTACPTIGANDSTGWCVCQASATAAPAATTPAADPCAQFSNLACIPFNGTCVRQGNSQCSCSGCKQTHASSTKNKPSAQPKTLAGQPTKPTLGSRLAPFTSSTPGRPAAPGATVNPLSHIVPGLA